MADRFPLVTPTDGSRKAAWTLVVLAPVSAEVTFSGVTMPGMWLLLPALVVMYGAGVLVLREMVARVGGGWPSLLVMGLIYELVEDGIGLQVLTSPNLYHAAEWGPRVLGFNTVYWESQIGYHTVFSVLIPVLLADLLFPSHRGRPYLGRRGFITAAVAAVMGVALLRAFVPVTQDPGYRTPLAVVLGILVAVTALLVVALRVLAPWTPPAARSRRIPSRSVIAIVAGAAAACFLGLLMPAGLPPDNLPDGPVIGDGVWVVIPMILAAVIAAAVGWLVYRWAASADWSDSHWVWLAGGALIGRTLFAVVTAPAANDYDWGSAGLAIALGITMIVVMFYLLTRLNQRIQLPQKHSPTI